MKRLLFIIGLILVFGCSSDKIGKKLTGTDKANDLIIKDLKVNYSKPEINNVQIKSYVCSPRNAFSSLWDYKMQAWNWRANASLQLDGTESGIRYKKEADSIYDQIKNLSTLESKYNPNDTFYIGSALVIKLDTTLYKEYYYDNNFTLLESIVKK